MESTFSLNLYPQRSVDIYRKLIHDKCTCGKISEWVYDTCHEQYDGQHGQAYEEDGDIPLIRPECIQTLFLASFDIDEDPRSVEDAGDQELDKAGRYDHPYAIKAPGDGENTRCRELIPVGKPCRVFSAA